VVNTTGGITMPALLAKERAQHRADRHDLSREGSSVAERN
jgi:hypothetical protein